jgi:hypothetical protein
MPMATRKRIQHDVQMNRGALTRFGYCLHCPDHVRHEAINKAAQLEGPARTARRLILLETWNKRKHPSVARIAHEDHNYLREHYLK